MNHLQDETGATATCIFCDALVQRGALIICLECRLAIARWPVLVWRLSA